MPEERLAKIVGASTLSIILAIVFLILGIVFRPKAQAQTSQIEPVSQESSQSQEQVAGASQEQSQPQATLETKAQGETYTVEAGDTLYALGLKFKIDWKKIAEANGITDQTALQVGQELIIPNE